MGEGLWMNVRQQKEGHVRMTQKVTQGCPGCLGEEEKNGQGCWLCRRKVQAGGFGV